MKKRLRILDLPTLKYRRIRDDMIETYYHTAYYIQYILCTHPCILTSTVNNNEYVNVNTIRKI